MKFILSGLSQIYRGQIKAFPLIHSTYDKYDKPLNEAKSSQT